MNLKCLFNGSDERDILIMSSWREGVFFPFLTFVIYIWFL